MVSIQEWINTSTSELILIYGEDDPWTVAAVQHDGTDNVIKIINHSTKHGTRITDLSSSDQSIVKDKLNEWISN